MIPPWLDSDGTDDRDRWPDTRAFGAQPDGDRGVDGEAFATEPAAAICRPDDRLAAQLADVLRCDPLVHGRHLEILVQNRVAILLGELDSTEARTAAGRRAWTVPGVHDVCNRLTVTELGTTTW